MSWGFCLGGFLSGGLCPGGFCPDTPSWKLIMTGVFANFEDTSEEKLNYALTPGKGGHSLIKVTEGPDTKGFTQRGTAVKNAS